MELRPVPGLLQVLAMLPLTHDEVVEAVEIALDDNPMLERASGVTCPSCGRPRPGGQCTNCAHARPSSETLASPFDELAALAMCEVRTECRPVMALFLNHLTVRGLLDSDAAEIADLHGVPLAHITECIRAVKAVGSVGVAERTVPELLAAQARVLVDSGCADPWLVDLVRDHLALVAARDANQVARLFATSEIAASRAFELIARRMRPFVSLGDDTQPVVRTPPDIVVSKNAEGVLGIEVEDSRWFGLRALAVPEELASHAKASEWLLVHQRKAHDLIRQLDSRANMLTQIARAAVEYQSDYFDQGPRAHRPLTRSHLASLVGVHASTVSRAVKDKRLRLPDGNVVDFADLFGTAVAVRAHLSALAQGTAMSDRKLCAELSARGFTVSRRAVAKYRAQLGIAAGGSRS